MTCPGRDRGRRWKKVHKEAPVVIIYTLIKSRTLIKSHVSRYSFNTCYYMSCLNYIILLSRPTTPNTLFNALRFSFPTLAGTGHFHVCSRRSGSDCSRSFFQQSSPTSPTFPVLPFSFHPPTSPSRPSSHVLPVFPFLHLHVHRHFHRHFHHLRHFLGPSPRPAPPTFLLF